ncbi:hypothetical protein Tco_1061771 [Tanacetum coccineum]
MRQLSFEETELDGEAGFGDVARSGVESSGLSHDESFGVDDLDLNLNEPVDLNVSKIETQYELPVFEEPNVGRTQEPIVKEVRTQEPIMEKVRTQEPIIEDVIVEDYVSFGEDAEQGIDTAYDTQYDVHSSEDASIDDDDDEDDDFLVDEESEIVEPDVNVHLFGISMDVLFEYIGVTNLVPDDEEKKFTTAKEAKDRVYMHFIESRRNLKMYKNDSVRVRAKSDGKVLVFTMSQGIGPTGLNPGIQVGPSGSSGPSTRSKKKEEYRACIRDLLGLDGAFMKGPFPGQVLAAVRPNSNNVIYPLVYALVELKVRVHGAGSDSHGIILAIKTVYPSVQHKYCLRHIHENMKQRWCRKAYKDLLWRAASAINVKDFEKYMLELKTMNPKAHEWLNKIPTEHWARTHFFRAKSNLLLNNICEVFNGVIDKCTGPLTPTTTRIMESIKKEAHLMKVQWNGANKYQVSGLLGDQCVVDVEKSTCTTTLLPPKHHVQVGRPKKKRKRSKHKDEPFVKDGKLGRKGRTITCQSYRNIGHNKATCKGQGRKATTGGNNAEGSGSESRQAQQTEPAVGQDGSSGSGAGVVIGLSAVAGKGGAGVAMSQTRNADGREISDGVPTQSSAAGGVSEWSFL